MDKRFPLPAVAEPAAFDYTSWRNSFILTVLRIACVIGLALILFNWGTTPAAARLLFLGMYVVLLLATFLETPYTLRAALLLLIIFIIGTNSMLGYGPWLDGSIFFTLAIVLAALLFDRWIDVVVLGLSIVTVAVIGAMQQSGSYQLAAGNLPVPTSLDWVAYIVDFTLPGTIMIIAIRQFKEAFIKVLGQMQAALQSLTDERRRLEERVEERTEELNAQTVQLRTSANVARIVAEIQDIPTLIQSVTSLVSDQFGYYHAGLYILDEQKKTAFLQAASSINGRQLVGQAFRIEPDRRNPLNAAIQQKRPVVTSDSDSTGFMNDPNFPLTRSRMVLPLSVRGEVIGLLDLHSDQSRTFGSQDTEILKTLSDLVAISYDNVRLINETRSLVAQLEASTSLQARETWAKFTSRRKSAYQYTPAGVRPLFSSDRRLGGPDEGLVIPLSLYGQAIGNIRLVRKGISTGWSDRERALVRKIADQVALALENSRLVDEAQKSALRDQMIANISSRVRETLDIESVVRTAATELRKVFDLKEAEISIGSMKPEKNERSANPGR